MGTMIECKYCKTLLPGDSLYCYQCGQPQQGNTADNDSGVDTSDAPEHLSEEDILTSISLQNASTYIGPLRDNPVTTDPSATVLDLNNEEVHPSTFSSEEQPTEEERPAEPVTGEVELVAELKSGDLLLPEEEGASADADVNATVIAEPEPVHEEGVVPALDEQPTAEQPLPLYAALSIDDYPTMIEEAPYLENDDDLANAITEPRLPVVAARSDPYAGYDEEVPAGYVMPSGTPQYPATPDQLTTPASGRSSLSRIVTIVSTVFILLAAIIGLVITGWSQVHVEAAQPMLTVTGNASPGGTIMVHGSHFIAGGDVTVLVDDNPITSASQKTLALAEMQMAAVEQVQQQLRHTSNAATTVVRDDGTFDKAFIVPNDWQPGSNHTIRATENGTNGNTIGAQVLVKVDNVIQTQQETPLPGTNPQVTVVAVPTTIPKIPTYPGPPQPAAPTHTTHQPTPTPKPSKPTPTPTPVKPTPTPPTPTAVPVTPTSVPITPTAVPVTPTAVPVTPTAVPVTPTAVPVTPTAVPVTPTTIPVTPTAVPVTPTPLQPTPTLPIITPTLVPVTPTTAAITPTPTTPGKHHHG
jgi:hypothetical protein